ncbi:hypothetical protein BGZ61DRAFT_457291 [Ilyonectria robusta]|uniref:uncharacterized protein n=1 Tax=Ilyonectria robusta TaxID=1079257 RepID=UPI001E8E6B1D|nr:uncharacterized protein BGZ61DRAFT_457291 [Ilyonectria robusta]KAH8676933.1 hypothetical protein BGZ61DRAFT_457291 [Ilyonectria robusta]
MKHPEPFTHEISHSAPVGNTCRIAMSYVRVTVFVACLVSSHPRLVFATKKKTCPSPSPSLLLLQCQSSTSQATGAASKTTPRTTTTRMDISGPNKANARVAEEGQREKNFQPFQPRWIRASFLMHLTSPARQAVPDPFPSEQVAPTSRPTCRTAGHRLVCAGPLTAHQIAKKMPHPTCCLPTALRNAAHCDLDHHQAALPSTLGCFNQDHIHWAAILAEVGMDRGLSTVVP